MAADDELIGLLTAREGRLTKIVLHDGQSLDVWNIAWGYDESDDHAHVTSNISPRKRRLANRSVFN